MLIRQLTEAQLLTSVKTAASGVFSIHWTGWHLSQLHYDSGLSDVQSSEWKIT